MARHRWEVGRYVEEFLYGLEADPYELSNLAGIAAYREVADQLHTRLLHHVAAAGEPPAKMESALPRSYSQRGLRAGDWLAAGRN
jgi:hypothetical protein